MFVGHLAHWSCAAVHTRRHTCSNYYVYRVARCTQNRDEMRYIWKQSKYKYVFAKEKSRLQNTNHSDTYTSMFVVCVHKKTRSFS